MKKSLLTLAIGISMLFSAQANAACDKVDVAEMNWASGQVLAKIIEFILVTGYDCEVNVVSTSTQPAIASMVTKGTPHINPEAWVNSIKKTVDEGLADKVITDNGDIFSDGGVEAWWIPAYMAETNPNIKTIQDVIANPQVFKDPEEPSKGRFYGCPAGWACRTISNNLARAYGMNSSFNIFDPGSGENLAGSIAKAYARKQPWVGYYWSPTAILGKFPMVQVQMNPHDATGHACNQTENCANPHAGQFPAARVAKLMVADYAKANKNISKFVSKMTISNDVVNKVLAWQEDNKSNASQTAGYFMASYPKIWKKWVPRKTGRKLSGAL